MPLQHLPVRAGRPARALRQGAERRGGRHHSRPRGRGAPDAKPARARGDRRVACIVTAIQRPSADRRINDEARPVRCDLRTARPCANGGSSSEDRIGAAGAQRCPKAPGHRVGRNGAGHPRHGRDRGCGRHRAARVRHPRLRGRHRSPGDERGLLYPALRMVIASRCAGLPAPIAGVTPAIDDEAQLRVRRSPASFGFGAKLCIHPRQVVIVHDALRPTPTKRTGRAASSQPRKRHKAQSRSTAGWSTGRSSARHTRSSTVVTD